MARATEPPDINATEAELESYWSGRDALMDEMERLRFIENPVEAPDTMQIEEVRNSIGYSMVERVVGMLVADEYRLSVPPADDTQRAARASEQMERWTQAALPEIAKVSEDDPLDRCVENMVALGHGCMRLVHAPHGGPASRGRRRSSRTRTTTKPQSCGSGLGHCPSPGPAYTPRRSIPAGTSWAWR